MLSKNKKKNKNKGHIHHFHDNPSCSSEELQLYSKCLTETPKSIST